MFESVCSWHHKVKVAHVLAIFKLRHGEVPRLESVLFRLHVVVEVVNRVRCRDVGSLEAVLNQVVEVRFTVVVKTGTEAPGV
jgi:hypothetical protein